jgi:GNAT superfamily N-acetyltransferase
MLMLENEVSTAGDEDRGRVFEILTAAFAADPAVRWMYPDEKQYRRHFPRFADAFAGRAIERGTAELIENMAVALWLPPGAGPDETMLAHTLEESLPKADRGPVFALFEQMAGHHPREAHWYLPLIGVEPTGQGRGYGSDLLNHALRRCRREGFQAYLESTNPRNIPLYERLGFRAVGRIQIGSSPPIVSMLYRPEQ